MQTEQMKICVEQRLDDWGREFALYRDHENLGFRSKNFLQVAAEHKGMPGRVTGFRPLEVDQEAYEVELIVYQIGASNPLVANVLRAFYAGSGRKGVERYELAQEMCRAKFSKRVFFDYQRMGFDLVFERLGPRYGVAA